MEYIFSKRNEATTKTHPSIHPSEHCCTSTLQWRVFERPNTGCCVLVTPHARLHVVVGAGRRRGRNRLIASCGNHTKTEKAGKFLRSETPKEASLHTFSLCVRLPPERPESSVHRALQRTVMWFGLWPTIREEVVSSSGSRCCQGVCCLV